MSAVLDYINKTSSIKSVYLVGRWDLWFNRNVRYSESTIQLYLSMKVRLYVIQESPSQMIPSYKAINLYKSLLDKGQLTSAHLRRVSCSRYNYVKQQVELEKVFSKFKEIRGLTFINVDDVICDAEVCPVGTGEQPYFADSDHMTPFGASRLKARFQKYLSY
jgi:hypothetical protein